MKEKMQRIIDDYWEDIAFLAYEGYHTSGRGAVFLENIHNAESPSEQQIRIGYAVYEHNAGKPDPDTARLIAAYDPAWEVILQYMRQDESVHTLRLKTAPGAQHPWRIWFFEKIMQWDGGE